MGSEKVEEVRGYLHVRAVEKHKKYLGLPTKMERSKNEVLDGLGS